MEGKNWTLVTEFVLLGFSDHPEYESLLFALFLMIYTVTVLGNLVIMLVILADAQLHIPMYFFLGNLAFVDICLTSVTLPELLVNLLSETKIISLYACMTQLYCFIALGNMENFLLAVMSIDRYVAICHPLRYTVVMSRRVCLQMVASSWILVSLHSLLHTVLTARLPFCGPSLIRHFFCEMTPLFELSCSDTSTNELVIFTEGSLSLALPFLLILFSYLLILSTVLRIRSLEGKRRALSTCASHLTAVILFYGTLFSIYFRPSSSHSLDKDRVVSLMYTVITPTLNPFIYSLRNKDLKEALRKIIHRNLL
ncbi:olfactory receptor 1f45-like [Ambystoma mexicanum]|uniref:olfactory receptor 1f45-like n=1 Tax=Ambystoma mexicanum TaxID=8296 RepID=UPI0037E92725